MLIKRILCFYAHFYSFFLLIATNAFADIQEITKTPNPLIASTCIASQEGLPISIVNGSVCAITGEFLITQTDVILPGPQPLALQRTYNSGTNEVKEVGSLLCGWELCFPNRLTLENKKIGSCPHHDHSRFRYELVLTEASGAKLSYHGHPRSTHQYSLHFNIPAGFTNCASGELSARTHLKNQNPLDL